MSFSPSKTWLVQAKPVQPCLNEVEIYRKICMQDFSPLAYNLREMREVDGQYKNMIFCKFEIELYACWLVEGMHFSMYKKCTST